MKRIVSLLLCAVLLTCVGCAEKPLSATKFLMDTACSVTLYDTQDTAILEGCFTVIRDDEQIWSRTIDGSEINLLNRLRYADLQEKTATLLSTALSYSTLTDGAFDITTAPLTDLWKAAEEADTPPSEEDIRQALSHVGAANVALDGDTTALHNGALIDLGGIAKGAVADDVAAYLKENGCQRALIDLGGNLVVLGSKKDGAPFSIGIAHPEKDGALIATVAVTDNAVVTSGSYERGYTIDGKRYSHIIDPHSGYPVDNDLLSVTILCPSATEADILSTACFVLGYNRARELIATLDNTDAVFVLKDGSVQATDGVTFID